MYRYIDDVYRKYSRLERECADARRRIANDVYCCERLERRDEKRDAVSLVVVSLFICMICRFGAARRRAQAASQSHDSDDDEDVRKSNKLDDSLFFAG
jgi:hypothetical protein